MSQPSYMKIYAKDAYVEIAHLTLEETGALYRLRCLMWMNGGKILDDDSKIARGINININKWKKVRGNLAGNIGGNLVQMVGGYLTISGLIEEYEAALSKRNKLAVNGGLGGKGVKDRKFPENQESDIAIAKANAMSNAPPEALANEKQTNSNPKADATGMHKQLQKPLSSSLSLSLTDKDNDDDTRENNVNHFSRRSKSNQHTGPMALAALLPPVPKDNSINGRLEAVFTKHQLPFPVDVHLVHSWLEGGADFDRDILPAIKGVCERVIKRLLRPPQSFAYFQETVASAALKNSLE